MTGTAGEGGLAILAGTDALPRLIAEAARDRGEPYLVVAFQDCHRPWMDAHPLQHHRFEKIGRLFRSLRRAGMTRIVFVGAMNRPRVRIWQADFKALTLAARVLPLLRRGDDAMLRGLAAILESEGFTMVAPRDLLPDIDVAPGRLTRRGPSAEDRADILRARAILDALGPHDVGQACVVARGLVLGIEAIEGTDALLSRVAALPAARRGSVPPPSGVLVKLPKPGQNRRLDLPTIGPQTVEGVVAAGLSGIAVEAGGVTLIDREAVLAALDAEGLFMVAEAPQ